MKRWCLVVLGLIILIPISANATESYKDWKAPPPAVSPKVVVAPKPTVEVLKPHQVLVNEIVEQERLPYVKIMHHDLKIAINPSVLEKYGLRSGDEIPRVLMDKIIEEDRAFQKGLLQ